MREITLEELLEAGCHFGHQVTRSNPRARDFIYEARDNIHIIDLAKTKQCLEEAGEFIKSLGGKEESRIIVVGTKRQAKGIIEEEIKRVYKEVGSINQKGSGGQQLEPQAMAGGLFYVTSRWVGGLLTNFSEVSKNFEKLKKLSEDLKNEDLKAKYTKKEMGLWAKERQKLEGMYGGVADLKEKPDALFIIDSHLESLAVKEARRMGVATVAIVDTNADPDIIDYPIPANDDAVGSIKLITSYIIDAWIEGRKSKETKGTKETKIETKVSGPEKEEKEGKGGKRKPRTAKKTS